MNNTKLLQIIHRLSTSDCRQAKLWLASPLHNQRQDVARLFDYLEETIFHLRLEPKRTDAFRYVFPDELYHDQKLRLVMSRLLKCLESWLSWRVWQADVLEKGNQLLRAFRELDLDKHFNQHRRAQDRQIADSKLRHHVFHLQRYQYEQEIYRWESHQGRGRPLNLGEQEKALQLLFVSHKLRLACLAIAHERVSSRRYELAFMPAVLSLAKESPYCDEPAVSIYHFVYQMYQQPGQLTVFQQYGQLLYQHFHRFPTDERRDLLLLGINYCIRQINNHGASFLREAFALYKQGLDANLLLEDGWLTNFTYTNIAILSIRLGEWDWGEQFIHDYRELLAPQQRQSIFALNAARLAYAKKDYRSALLHLHNFDDRDFIHQLGAKIIQLKVYFESGDFQLLAAHIKNTRAFLRRVKDASYHKQIYVNIFALTDQLMKLPPYDDVKRKALREQILNTEPLTERTWLLEQLDS